MGVSRLTYCGPFVECKCQQAAATYEKQRCSNPACKMHTVNVHDRFCGQCGSAIVTVEFPCEADAVDSWELDEELGDVLWQPFTCSELLGQGTHIWIGDEPERPLCVYQDEESVTELQPTEMETELTWFEKQYNEPLNRLRAAYGSDNVKVKWGILHSIR
jgi:hypothetical protein